MCATSRLWEPPESRWNSARRKSAGSLVGINRAELPNVARYLTRGIAEPVVLSQRSAPKSINHRLRWIGELHWNRPLKPGRALPDFRGLYFCCTARMQGLSLDRT